MNLSAQTMIAESDVALPGLSQASMMTSDGIRLDADIWSPPGDGPAPVLLMRQAYGRRLGSALCYAHPAWYARQGFLVVIQDVRGRGTSEGDFAAFEHEARDGAEAIEWAAALPRSNGRVGLYGFSYQGTNQLLAAGLAPPALRAIAPAMIGWDLRTDWASEGEAFRLASNIGWGIQMAAGTAAHRGDDAAWNALFAASRQVPVQSEINSRPAVLENNRKLGHYHDWLERPKDDPYWARVSPSRMLPQLKESGVPALLIGGWFDTHLPGTLAAFEALRTGCEAKLLVGPWTHFPWDRHVADRDFGPDAVTRVDHVQLRWFRRWLTVEGEIDDSHADEGACISLFDLGACQWREADDWPKGEVTLHLAGNGLASVDVESGSLDGAPAAETMIDYLVHDPWRPAPSVGGAFGTPPGPVDRRLTDNRSDVLTFTTARLESPLAIFGQVEAQLSLVSDRSSFDVACTLSRIDGAGQVTQIAEGYRTVGAGQANAPVEVSLRSSCATIPVGERLRLSIAAASYPAYPVNPGDGRQATEVPRREAGLITVGVVTGGAAQSLLRLAVGENADA